MTPEQRAARTMLVHRIRHNTTEPEWLVLDYDENGWGYAVAGNGDQTRRFHRREAMAARWRT